VAFGMKTDHKHTYSCFAFYFGNYKCESGSKLRGFVW